MIMMMMMMYKKNNMKLETSLKMLNLRNESERETSGEPQFDILYFLCTFTFSPLPAVVGLIEPFPSHFSGE